MPRSAAMVESASQSAAAQQLQENASSKRLFFDLFAILALAAQARLAFFSEALGTDEIVYLTRAQHILHGECLRFGFSTTLPGRPPPERETDLVRRRRDGVVDSASRSVLGILW